MKIIYNEWLTGNLSLLESLPDSQTMLIRHLNKDDMFLVSKEDGQITNMNGDYDALTLEEVSKDYYYMIVSSDTNSIKYGVWITPTMDLLENLPNFQQLLCLYKLSSCTYLCYKDNNNKIVLDDQGRDCEEFSFDEIINDFNILIIPNAV